jgi:cytochrome P450 family 49 subfamily A
MSLMTKTRVALRSPFWRLKGMQLMRFKSFSVTKRSHEQMNPSTALPFDAIPGPTPLENIVRYIRGGVRDYHVFLEKNFQRYGPIFKYVMPGMNVVHVCDPNDIERVFRNEGYPASRGDLLKSATYYREKGLPTSFSGQDESWHVHRSAVAPKLLPPRALKPFFAEQCNVADDTIVKFKDGRNPDISDQLAKLAMENIAVMIFGVRLGLTGASPDPKAREFADAVFGHFTAESKLLFSIPFHEYFKTPTLKELHRCLDKEFEMADHFMKNASQMRTPLPALASKCLVHRLAEEDKISPEEIFMISESALSGGVHTTFSSLIILLHALGKQPEAQQKIYDEIQSVLHGKQQPTYKQFLNMPYVKAFMKEVFRIQSSPLGNARVLAKPILLSGYHIPAGVRIVLSAVATESIQEKSYGPDFATFAPKRWLRSSTRSIHPFASLPFGFGPRMCIGKRFAEMEMAVFLIRLLQNYEVVDSKLKEDQVEWYFNILLTPTKPYNLNLKKRV